MYIITVTVAGRTRRYGALSEDEARMKMRMLCMRLDRLGGGYKVETAPAKEMNYALH